MQEAAAIAERLGVRFRVSIERRIEGAAAVGEHKTSMLQDVEAGRPLELDALMGSVLELARLVEVPTPHMDTVYAVTSLLARTLIDKGARLKLDALSAGGSAGSTG
jgi:2-dehydropantoate 2-reductase